MKPGTYLKIVADSNDADYHTEINLIDNVTLERFQPLIKAISKFKPYRTPEVHDGMFEHRSNWPKGEYGCREDLGEKPIYELYNQIDCEIIDQFDEEYVPDGYEGSIHTIESIEVIEVSKITKLL